ncbi:hypothetical protein Patl1_15306 [Pistacia atlantica]|uniref:Uncharacterized protein n=1 Tax=Pistacia atlantica TaxID=434234 RepID=A0ACC1B9G1_9ROSI|nr:hypothetical protein Patl1_15306 [Pistacia atlantica]
MGAVTDVGIQQNEGSRAYAIVHFTSSEAADTIKSLAEEHLWFSSLWTQENVSVKFGFGLRKIIFFLSHHSVEYKLQLPYESIRLVELRRLQDKRFIIIQLFGVPRIYSKDVPEQTFFRDDNDVQWVQEVDFTPSSCIGQPTALCLELPTTGYLSDFQKDFAYYKETDRKLVVKRGSTSSCHSDHVPIHGCIPRPIVDVKFFRMVEPHRRNIAFVEHALETLFYSKQCCFAPQQWLRKEYQKYSMAARPPMLHAISLSHGLVYMCRVLVTPSKFYFFGPEVVLSNNVLCTYPDDGENFIHVSFVNEDLEKIRAIDLFARVSLANTERRTRVYQRILSTLRNGIFIGDKKFEFLAFSNNQLKDNSLWMFASRPGLTPSEIRERLGDFSAIRNVAKYSARLGQSFSSSKEAVDVDSNEIEIQSGGYKGVVAVDPTSSTKLSMRPSMSKYKSDNVSLDILEWSQYQPCYLNRQLVILLSTLGHQTELSNNSSALLSGRVSSQSRILEQRVIVAKNPCLHPRDVRKLKAVNVPALHHMVNCIVFPAKGKSDLDGDIYFVCWDGDLIPRRMYPPMDYTSAPPKILDNEVTIDDVEEYFADYMVNENLGMICNAHAAFANKSPFKAISFPDYLEKLESESYESQSVIGKLYREVKDLMPKLGTLKSFTADKARQSYDLDMEVEGFKDYIDDAFYYKSEYDYRLGNLMDYFGISTEGGRIMKMAKSFSKKRDLEGIKLVVNSLIREAREWFNKKANKSDGPEKVYMKALAWYYVTYHPSFWGQYNKGLNCKHFLSFPWCVHDKRLKIKGDRQSIMKISFVS